MKPKRKKRLPSQIVVDSLDELMYMSMKYADMGEKAPKVVMRQAVPMFRQQVVASPS